MEESKNIKKIIKVPVGDNQNIRPINRIYKTLTVITFIMVCIMFIRGFGIKGTVNDQSLILQEKIVELNNALENSRQIDKNEILSAFALYSRLDQVSLKEREDYHKEQQFKYEKMANQYNKGLNDLTNQIKLKDTTK